VTLADILLLLRQDLNQTFRISGAKGKRTEQKSALRRFLRPLVFVVIAVVIIWAIVTIVPLFGWRFIADIVISDPGLGATIFNLIFIFGFIGSIAVSATTVGNVNRMEYLLTMPIPMRTVFLEKTIIIILYNSTIWMVIGVPIFIGLSIVSPVPLAALSIPVFIVLLFSEEYLPAVQLFRILLPGIVALSASRILANDIAGRGKPLLNTYIGVISVALQLALNLAWIPRFGAMGSAWATTIAYSSDLGIRLWLYMKVSGNSLAEVILPRSSDWSLYRQLAQLAWSRVRGQAGHY